MSNSKSNIIHIETPEGIKFSLRLAGPVSRFLAWSLDLMCITLIANIINEVVGVLVIISYDFAMAFSVIVYFVISIGYSIVMEYFWRGQTIGKRIFRLRVMDDQGLNLRFNQVVIRNLLRFVDILPFFYMVGGLACLISNHAQRLGDLAANTIVIWSPKIPVPDLDQVMSDKYNSFHDYPHLEARLRQRISPHEAGIGLQAILRREQLEPKSRVELFRDIASHYKGILEFPQEATEGISDEQYVRNAVDSIFRSQSSS